MLFDKGLFLGGNKHERIISLEPDIKKGHIIFNSDNIGYNKQIKDYNKNAKNDDAPDSLYMAVRGMQGVKKLKFYDKKVVL